MSTNAYTNRNAAVAGDAWDLYAADWLRFLRCGRQEEIAADKDEHTHRIHHRVPLYLFTDIDISHLHTVTRFGAVSGEALSCPWSLSRPSQRAPLAKIKNIVSAT